MERAVGKRSSALRSIPPFLIQLRQKVDCQVSKAAEPTPLGSYVASYVASRKGMATADGESTSDLQIHYMEGACGCEPGQTAEICQGVIDFLWGRRKPTVRLQFSSFGYLPVWLFPR